MKLHILAAGSARGKDLTKLDADPDFRKATRNMKLAFAALEPILEAFPALCSDPRVAFVLGSSYGELDATSKFLGTLSLEGMARPLLFQTSLHNATLGFLALKLGLRGPSATTSRRYFTGESCLEIAALLLGAGAPACLALGVEGEAHSLLTALARCYPAGVEPVEGAGALLVASEAGARELGARPLAVIEDIFYEPESAHGYVAPEARNYYDSNALEALAAGLPGTSGELRLAKPDGSASLIRLTGA